VRLLRPSLGRALGAAEHGFGLAWSAGELAVMLRRPRELLRDRHRDALHASIAREGFHPTIDDERLALAEKDGVISGSSPYTRVTSANVDRVLGRRIASKRPSKRLVFVCHCYGIPSPRTMGRLFGLFGDRDFDVAYNVMAHHQPGTYVLWPGSGLVSASPSRFVDNLRSAVTGARALLRWLVQRYGYERVDVIGFSIGGQLALHLSNAEPVDGAILYCPVADLASVSRGLGLMRHVHPHVESLLARGGITLDDLDVADPLAHASKLAQERTHVIVQKHDALTPLAQVERIRRVRPNVRWHELEGTHLYPADLSRLHRLVREALAT
jgi:predicted esterase